MSPTVWNFAPFHFDHILLRQYCVHIHIFSTFLRYYPRVSIGLLVLCTSKPSIILFYAMLSAGHVDQRTAYISALLKAFATLSSAMFAVPRLRLVESNLCRTHYQNSNHSVINPSTDTVPEGLCKIAQVQTDLAFLLGWDSFFQNVPGVCCLYCKRVIALRDHADLATASGFIFDVFYSIFSKQIDDSRLVPNNSNPRLL